MELVINSVGISIPFEIREEGENWISGMRLKNVRIPITNEGFVNIAGHRFHSDFIEQMSMNATIQPERNSNEQED